MKSPTIEIEEKKPLVPRAASINNMGPTIKILKAEFDALTKISDTKEEWDKLKEEDRIENNHKKLAIMQTVYASIQKTYAPPDKELESKHEIKEEAPVWRHVAFFLLVGVDVIILVVGGYLGSVSLLQLIVPGLANILGSAVALIVATIEGLMRYSTLKPALKQELGMKPDQPDETLPKSYDDRLILMEKINTLMANNLYYIQEKGYETYAKYADILKAFNTDIAKIRLIPYKEPLPQKITRYALTLLNVGLNMAATYFAAVVLLTLISAPLIGTPLGWGIIATMVIVQLAAKFLLNKSSIYTFLNPNAEKHEEVRKKLNKFTDKTNRITQNLNTIKELHELKIIKDEKRLRTPSNPKPTHSAEYPFFQRKPKTEVVPDLKGPANVLTRRMSFS